MRCFRPQTPTQAVRVLVDPVLKISRKAEYALLALRRLALVGRNNLVARQYDWWFWRSHGGL